MNGPKSTETKRDLSDILGLLPMDIIESVLVSLIKVLGEQPAVETALDLAEKVAAANHQQQNQLTEQLLVNNLTVAATVKIMELITAIDPKATDALEKIQRCLANVSTLPGASHQR